MSLQMVDVLSGVIMVLKNLELVKCTKYVLILVLKTLQH